jgi:hypothetical protein
MARLHHQVIPAEEPGYTPNQRSQLGMKQALVMEFTTATALKTMPEKIMKG